MSGEAEAKRNFALAGALRGNEGHEGEVAGAGCEDSLKAGNGLEAGTRWRWCGWALAGCPLTPSLSPEAGARGPEENFAGIGGRGGQES